MSPSLVQQQFGANAARYVSSRVHAQGASLQRMVQLAQPRNHWLAVDVAPGGGHSALAVAPLVQQVIAVDITHDILLAARTHSNRVGQDNIVWVQGDGEALPLPSHSIDLITCRVALHHFPDPVKAVRDWARVLRPQGRLVLVDNIGPDDEDAALYINTFEKIRDPSHCWMHPFHELVSFVLAAGLHLMHTEHLQKPMSFYAWMDRMQVNDGDRQRLHRMLWQSQGEARAFLNPQGEGSETTFSLREGIILAEKR